MRAAIWKREGKSYVDHVSLLRRVCRGLWYGCCLSVLIVIGGVSMLVFAGEPGSIRGSVRMQGTGIVEHRIMLIRFGPGQEVQRTPGHTDTEGHFVFEQLETDAAFEYVVGIRYKDTLYRSASIRLQPGQNLTDVWVEVDQSSTQARDVLPATLYIANHLKVVVLRNDRLEIREIVHLVKPEPASAADHKERFSLHLPLPQGYHDLTNLQGLDAAHVRLEPSGLFYTAPLASGEHRIVFSYAMPFRHKVATMLSERSLPTVSLEFFVQDGQLVASSDLRFEGRLSLQPHTFLRFRGTDLSAQSRSWLQVTRLSGGAPFLQVLTYSVIVGLVLFGIIVSWISMKRSQSQAEIEPTFRTADVQALKTARFRLLNDIARLDDLHETGMVNQTTYRRQRETYKQQLLVLYEQLQAAPQDKEVLADGDG